MGLFDSFRKGGVQQRDRVALGLLKDLRQL